MKPTNYTCLSSDWDVDLQAGVFSSPSKDAAPGQVVLFDREVKNGFISVLITAIGGRWNSDCNCAFREGAMIFRYTDEKHFYLAGIGGFGKKFYIAKVSPSGWLLLSGTGLLNDLTSSLRYDMRAEFHGNQIALFHNGISILRAIDSSYSSGLPGLRTWNTVAKFENVEIEEYKPKCFVIMPFTPELDNVWGVIKETVKGHGVECERADDDFLSKPILETVKSKIASAEIVIVDFTKKNANVYFEAGLADAWEKKWIVLAQSKRDLAFDVQHIRVIFYSDKIGSDVKLKEDLGRALKGTLEGMDVASKHHIDGPQSNA